MSGPDVASWIQSGDLRRAASSLVVSYGSDVLATCTAMVRDRSAAEDVTQDVFSEAIRALATFRGDASPRTWLLSIARNRCIDYLRARKRDPWAGAIDDAASDPDLYADQAALDGDWFAERSAVLRALDGLAEGDRALIVLRFKNGLEYDELATAFGLREGTVRMRVSRALVRMRGVLEADASDATLPGFSAGAPELERAALRGGAAPPGMGPPSGPLGAPPRMRARAVFVATPPEPAAAKAPAPPASAALPPAAFGAAVPAESSWWARLKAWAGLGAGAEHPVPPPPPPRPIGVLGLALSACEPSVPSDALAERLAALVERVPGAR